jgi:hypothetical protein
MQTDHIAPRAVDVEVKGLQRPLPQIMWGAVRMSLFSFMAGRHLSGPEWENRHDWFDYAFPAFWIALAIYMGFRLRRLVVEVISGKTPSVF